jgi:hypothetical protein
MELGTDVASVDASVARLAAALTRAVADFGTGGYRRLQAAGMRAAVGWDGPAAEWQAFIEDVASGAHDDA